MPSEGVSDLLPYPGSTTGNQGYSVFQNIVFKVTHGSTPQKKEFLFQWHDIIILGSYENYNTN